MPTTLNPHLHNFTFTWYPGLHKYRFCYWLLLKTRTMQRMQNNTKILLITSTATTYQYKILRKQIDMALYSFNIYLSTHNMIILHAVGKECKHAKVWVVVVRSAGVGAFGPKVLRQYHSWAPGPPPHH